MNEQLVSDEEMRNAKSKWINENTKYKWKKNGPVLKDACTNEDGGGDAIMWLENEIHRYGHRYFYF